MIRKTMLALLALCTVIGMPAWADEPGAHTERIFELRTYTAAPGKLDELHRRFREHTLKFFEQHGMENIGYWTPQGPASTNTIVYLLAHKNKAAAEKSWAAFGADPEWQKVKRASEANGALVTKVESVFLNPTDYSSMR